MIFWRFVWGGLKRRWGSALLSVAVGALSLAGLCLILWAQTSVPEAVKARIAETDMVVGPKSSGLDLALCCALHLTPARGLMDIHTATDRLEAPDIKPYIRQSVPVAMGDSYGGARIVWTQPEIIPFYEAKLVQGRVWQKPLEVVAGAGVAKTLNLKIGQRFQSTHGLTGDSHRHEASYVVTGILAPTGGVLDHLLLADLGSIERVHGAHAPDKAHEDHDHEAHDHTQGAAPLRINALLVRFKSQIAQASVPSLINESEGLSAASPRLELARLMALVRPMIDLATVLALVLGAVAVLILALTLIQGLNRRARDFMLLRFLGMSHLRLALIAVGEAMILIHAALAGGLGMAFIAQTLVARKLSAYGLGLSADVSGSLVLTVYAGAVGLGLMSAVVPIVRLSLARDDEELRA
ncbi:MAG: hypothetical protein QM645_03820 [Asticcacaulis sp.]